MSKLIDEAIKVVLKLIHNGMSADEALKTTQAVTNLANAKATIEHLATTGDAEEAA